MIDIIERFKIICKQYGVPFEQINDVRPYDDSTLFCPAGMQRYKEAFKTDSLKGHTFANIQPCIRMNDFHELGDATHLLYFNMIGLFSFKDMIVKQAIRFFVDFMGELGIDIDYATIHPDKLEEWDPIYARLGINTEIDPECKWSDGEIGGYCTEFYYKGVEIGNIVNPLGNCIDVGFGLERLDMLVNGKTLPSKEESLKRTIEMISNSGYRPGPKLQGYVLRKLMRELYLTATVWDHPLFEAEVKRQNNLKKNYEKLKDKFSHQSPEWWYDTHGITISDYQ